MARKPNEKGAETQSAQESSEPKIAQEQTEEKHGGKTEETTEGMNILEALEAAGRGRKVARNGWSEHIRGTYMTIVRGETKPSLVTGKYRAAYAPSIEDLMANDWNEITK
ncbi:Thoeris anti-defense Tad2 family protein [Hydrogenimonas sp.]